MKKIWPLFLLVVLFSCTKLQRINTEETQDVLSDSQAVSGAANEASIIPNNNTEQLASPDKSSTEMAESEPVAKVSEEIEDGYKMITWWNLLSDLEFTYYKDRDAAYESDPDFYPSTTPPAPEINPDINGLKVRIPGFIVGVDSDPDNFAKISSFLFVPYQGACIHVPPPPINQTIFSTFDESFQSDPYTPYWLYGTISVEEGDNGIAAYSYTLAGDKLELYEE